MLSVEPADGYAVLTLERPEKRNALAIELRMPLAEARDRPAPDAGTGRVLDAREALAFGVVSELVEPPALMSRARELASGIGAAPRTAAETKRRVLLDGERTWMALLEDETRVLREALLG